MLLRVQALIEVIVTREESPLPPPEQSQDEHRGVNMAETRDTDEDEEIARHKKTIATKEHILLTSKSTPIYLKLDNVFEILRMICCIKDVLCSQQIAAKLREGDSDSDDMSSKSSKRMSIRLVSEFVHRLIIYTQRV